MMKKERCLNIELLRIVAMFLVLVVHSDFFSLGVPARNDLVGAPSATFGRFFFQGISVVCVNVFVLISGWFGIKPSIRSFAGFVFQCLYFLIGIYVLCLLFGIADLSLRNVAGCFFLLKWNWFIKAYIGLYILSPLMNAFVEKSSKTQFRFFLISFYVFQFIYGWTGAAEYYCDGYSTMSFIGLYMLARYIKIYSPRYSNLPWYVYGGGYVAIAFLLAAVSMACLSFDIYLFIKLYSYISPIVILASLCLLLLFSKLEFHNFTINKIASSTFAVFLLHTNPNLCTQYFVPTVQSIYASYSGVVYLLISFAFLISIYLLAVILDQFRILIWNKMSSIVWKYDSNI